jgi:hypothetical protein
MFKAVPLFNEDPNFKLVSDDPIEQLWLDRNMERVMDTFVRVTFNDQCQFRGFHNIDTSKLTYRKYLEYGRSCDGSMQFYADLTGETLNLDSRLDRETAYLVWLELTRGMGWTKSNLDDLADMAASLYREDCKPKFACDDYDRGRRIEPKFSLRRG